MSFFRVKTEEEATALANDCDFSLAGSVWGKDEERGKRVASQIDARSMFVNNLDWADADPSFGGINKSSYGRELGGTGMQEFVNKKLVRSGHLPAPTWARPPLRAAHSIGHLAAHCGALGASLGAALAVVHVVCTTFGRTPVANVRAQHAKLFDKGAVARGRVSAQPADRRAFDTAGRTGIDAFLSHHVRKTIAAGDGANVAGVDAVLGVLIQVMTHDGTP